MPDRLQRMESLFHAALERPQLDRLAFLIEKCGADSELLKDILSLLEHEGQSSAAMEVAVQRVADNLVTSAASNYPPGMQFGQYRLIRQLGSGGMGPVYLARDSSLERNVAIKFLRHSWADSMHGAARLKREARAAASLSHPNIAGVYDLIYVEGSPVIIMEHVEGVTLRSRMLAGQLRPAVLRELATQLAAALEHAHLRGVIHRDLKPENVMVTSAGNVKLLDFGLARLSGERPASEELTGSGNFVGTLRYAAPEVVAGQEATRQSDVYSLGAMLYELAVSEALFVRLSGAALVSAILRDERPRARDLNPVLHPKLATLIDRCISWDPADRYRDGADLRTRIELSRRARYRRRLTTAFGRSSRLPQHLGHIGYGLDRRGNRRNRH